MKLDLQGPIAKQLTRTILLSTLTQYHTLGKVPRPFLFQNQPRKTTLAQTTNSYHFYHIMPKHKRKRYYHKQQKTFQLFVINMDLNIYTQHILLCTTSATKSQKALLIQGNITL